MKRWIIVVCVAILAGCGKPPDSNYAPVVCEALSQYEHWQGFRSTDGHVLLRYDGDTTGLPDSLSGWPVKYVDMYYLLQSSHDCWRSVYELQFVFSDDRHFDVLVYHHYSTHTSGGKPGGFAGHTSLRCQWHRVCGIRAGAGLSSLRMTY